MIQVEHRMVIQSPLDQVFEYITNMENMPQWAGGIVAAVKITKGPKRAGTTFRLTAQPPIGATIVSDYAFTEYKVNTGFSAVGSVGPIPFNETWEFRPVPEGTEIHPLMRFEPRGMFRLAQPLLQLGFRRLIHSDMAKLKKVLENRVTVSAIPARQFDAQ
jgi:uncharacterized membrane protein